MVPFKQILVATDFGPAADRALAYGADLARRFGATLHVVNVVDNVSALVTPIAPSPIDLGTVQKEAEHEARERLRLLLLRECPDLDAKEALLVSHRPAFAILDYARESDIDLIVAGTHGRSGLSDLFLGSVAQKLVRSATCPVLTTHALEATPEPVAVAAPAVGVTVV